MTVRSYFRVKITTHTVLKLNIFIIKWYMFPCFLQLNIEACDDNSPQKCDFATAFVTILRQQFPPTFIGTPYEVSISEFRQTGSSIFKVVAEDQDIVGQIEYGTEGIVPAPTYFTCDSNTGEIRVARDLRQDRRTTYTVREQFVMAICW